MYWDIILCWFLSLQHWSLPSTIPFWAKCWCSSSSILSLNTHWISLSLSLFPSQKLPRTSVYVGTVLTSKPNAHVEGVLRGVKLTDPSPSISEQTCHSWVSLHVPLSSPYTWTEWKNTVSALPLTSYCNHCTNPAHGRPFSYTGLRFVKHTVLLISKFLE